VSSRVHRAPTAAPRCLGDSPQSTSSSRAANRAQHPRGRRPCYLSSAAAEVLRRRIATATQHLRRRQVLLRVPGETAVLPISFPFLPASSTSSSTGAVGSRRAPLLKRRAPGVPVPALGVSVMRTSTGGSLAPPPCPAEAGGPLSSGRCRLQRSPPAGFRRGPQVREIRGLIPPNHSLTSGAPGPLNLD
jgi:hypothetical protein